MSVRRYSRPFVLFLIAAIAAVCASGCTHFNKGRKLVVDEFVVNINAINHEDNEYGNQWERIRHHFDSRDITLDTSAMIIDNCRPVGSYVVCDHSNIILAFDKPVTLKEIEKVHQSLLQLRKDNVTLGLEFGTVYASYSALGNEGLISTWVRIAVTPGAQLFLERKQIGACDTVFAPENVYEGPVRLYRGQEWVYYRTELDTGADMVRRYFRLHVLERRQEELSEKEFKKLIRRKLAL